MPELDPLDVKLTAAVRSYADRADTRVDAMAVAGRVVRQRRFGALGLFGRTVPVPVSILLLLAFIALLAFSMTVGGLSPIRLPGLVVDSAASPMPAVTASPTPVPTPSPIPADPMAPAFATGTGRTTIEARGTTTVDKAGIAHTVGVVLVVVTAMGDPRLTGTGTYRLAVDASGKLGFASGTLRLENAGGAWEGRCTGATRDGLADGTFSCWLVGSGAYAGLTYYVSHHIAASGGDTLTGVVLEGSPPSP